MRVSAAAESSLESRRAAGVITLFFGATAALVAGLALAAATSWPPLAVFSCALAFGVLVGMQTRFVGSGPIRGWTAVAGRAAIAVAVGVVVGELAALVVFAGAIDRTLDERAARSVASVPAVVQASAGLSQSRSARSDLDVTVEQSRARLDEALVVARCEYNPSADCPQTHITGMPGRGPESFTANELLASARQDLDRSIGARELRAPELDAAIVNDERALANARSAAIVGADRGLGARWVAMQDYTLAAPGALLLRLATIAFFVLLGLLPLVLTLLRGQSVHDRREAAYAERERAEIEADTAIAVKRTEVRRTAEILWAEQQLASVRLAVDAQHEVDRAQYRRRVAEIREGRHVAFEGPHVEFEGPQVELEGQHEELGVDVSEQRQLESTVAETLPARADEHLPAPATSEAAVGGQPPAIPSLPELTKSAARWIRPLVPDIVAKAIDSTTHPVRTARQVWEEVEEINFSLRRTHTVTVHSEDSPPPEKEQERELIREDVGLRRVDSSFVPRDLDGAPVDTRAGAVASGARRAPLEVGKGRHRRLPEAGGVRQLPPGE